MATIDKLLERADKNLGKASECAEYLDVSYCDEFTAKMILNTVTYLRAAVIGYRRIIERTLGGQK